MPSPHSPRFRYLSAVIGIVSMVFLSTSGCSQKEEVPPGLIPVTGTVTLPSGKAMPTGEVTFTPDSGKGNTANKIASGKIHSDGTYTLKTPSTIGKLYDGAPAGWYKVSVTIPAGSGEEAGKKIEPFNTNFTIPGKTKLSFEVKEGAKAGSYDIKLTQ